MRIDDSLAVRSKERKEIHRVRADIASQMPVRIRRYIVEDKAGLASFHANKIEAVRGDAGEDIAVVSAPDFVHSNVVRGAAAEPRAGLLHSCLLIPILRDH